MNMVSEEYRVTRYVTYLAQSTSISIEWFVGTDSRSWSLESPILLEEKQVLGIFNSAVKALDMLDTTKGNAWMELNGMAWWTILLRIQWNLQWQHGIRNDLNALWDQLKQDYMVRRRIIFSYCEIKCQRQNEASRQYAGFCIEDLEAWEQL